MPNPYPLCFDIRPVPQFSTLYVSDSGGVYSREGKSAVLQPRKQQVAKTGYRVVMAKLGNKWAPRYVHRLVAAAFHGVPLSNQVVRHLDGSRTNNVPTNLKWGTLKENTQDARLHDTIARGERHPHARLTRDSVRAIRAAASEGKSNAEIARDFDISREHARDIVLKKRWAHIH